MSLFVDILTIVLPVFLVIGLGFGLRRTALIDANFLFQLNRLIYYVALPALLFYKIATADFAASFNGMLVLGVVLSLVVAFALSYVYAWLRSYPPAARGTFCQGAFRGNLAYIGLAIVFNAYGEEGLAQAGILLGFLVPTLNLLAILALTLPHRQQRGQGRGLRFWLEQLAANPLIVASFAGIVWSFFHLPIPVIVDRALHIVAGMALPLALLAIGGTFSLERLRGDLGRALLATGSKIVGLPLLTAGVLQLLGVGGQELAIGVLFAGTPAATATYIMAQQMRGDAELAGSIIMLSTLFSVVTYTVALYLLHLLGI